MTARDQDPRSPMRRAQRLDPQVMLTLPPSSPSTGLSASPNSSYSNSNSDSEATAIGSSSGGSGSDNGARVKRNSSLGASIRRRFQEAKDSPIVRSISLRVPPASAHAGAPGAQGQKRHGRAFSSGSATPRPRVVPARAERSERQTGAPDARFAYSPFSNYASTSTSATATQASTTTPKAPGKPRRKSMADIAVPELLRRGVPMTKVSAKRQKTYVFQLDPDQGQILWVSKHQKIIPIENIKELRSAADARYYREQFQLAQSYEERWITIIYILDGSYKTLHLIAATADVFRMWDATLRKLYAVRLELMSGLGHVEMREAVWEKQYWKGADSDEGKAEGDGRLDFAEAERLCKRLNVGSSGETLMRLFNEADTDNNGYLDFAQFQHFVRMLKARPEVEQLYKKLAGGGAFDFGVFEAFMKESQKSPLGQLDHWKIFSKYATPPIPAPAPAVAPVIPASAEPPADAAPPPPPPKDPAPPPKTPSSARALPADAPQYTLSPAGFAAFLLSTENAAFADNPNVIQDGNNARKEPWMDMGRPLSEYYISTSHNTYLVGHQLVGVSTIEGYIRALLGACRSVELDIYDGEKEPVIFHGKTLTTKVPLSEVCHAIAKYAFVASPYPVIISAEIHCSLPFQDMIAATMSAIFGETLVKSPIEGDGLAPPPSGRDTPSTSGRDTPSGKGKIEVLPSPEALKGKILLKAKNLYVSASETKKDQERRAAGGADTGSSEFTETEPSSDASEAENQMSLQNIKAEWQAARESEGHAVKELKEGIKEGLRAKENEAIKDIKSEFKKARGVLERVRGRSKSPAPGSKELVTAPAPARSSTSSLALPPSTMAGGEKPKMSLAIMTLLVYTVGVKCRGINKKETYAPEHVFSLSETTANKMLKHGMHDLIKHNRTHVVRIYPKGLRFDSTNYEPHRYWSAGAQLVAINWQTFDMGYMINYAMFQRNGRCGYILKPLALRSPDKALLSKMTKHILDIKIISAQQLPRLKDASGREINDKIAIDPFVEVSIHVPDWTHSPYLPSAEDAAAYTAPNAPTTSVTTIQASLPTAAETAAVAALPSSPNGGPGVAPTTNVNSTARAVTYRTGVVKNNGFNPVWQEDLQFPFDCVGEMMDLVFVRFAVRHEGRRDEDEPLAIYCASLGSLQRGYRHLPLHDAQLSQYLFSTLFVQINVREA
ncbi:PLC-like phosphodiesterase [Athelia psychrophila]|uniref:Phosphoinositide phospholipase C n=1 Tax=Athelia psychrophila TaxID=1759441 RepID=A0A166IY28_9AGAM|nr:PLC-like phosphodiesterase [Fibularhizoctonia sp. CBS 109695]